MQDLYILSDLWVHTKRGSGSTRYMRLSVRNRIGRPFSNKNANEGKGNYQNVWKASWRRGLTPTSFSTNFNKTSSKCFPYWKEFVFNQISLHMVKR